jgi:UDP-4-amino-4,6-dideoxy-N-acetyl-beta-L-altrosamine transaminase
MRQKPLPYARQSLDETDIKAVSEILRSDWLTCGPTVEIFEKKLCELTNAKYAVVCSNGTAALHIACMALDISKGDLGITSPITFLASANCIEFCGGHVDFVDIDPATLCLSVQELEAYLKKGKRPKVVIPVDFAGVPADLPLFSKLSKRYGFKIIEDAAHSLGSTYNYNGKTCQCGSCAHSDLAIFSFHPVKAITTGEGGAVMTNNDALAEKVRLYRNHGMTKNPEVLTRNDGPWYYEMHELGYNYRITDMQCALGISQLEKLKEFKCRRQEIVYKYNKAFANNDLLITPPWPKNSSPCFHLYALQFRQGENIRRSAYDKLKQLGILTQVHYLPVYRQPYYSKKYGYRRGKCPAAELYYSRCLSLPLYPAMTDGDCELVVSSIKKYMEKK